jgi:hypothetical protein
MAKFTNRKHWEETVAAIFPGAQIMPTYHGAMASIRHKGGAYIVGQWDGTAPGMRSVDGAEAFAQGEQANADGDSLSANPHHSDLVKYLAWANGFDAFQVTRDEWEQSNHDRARMCA